ncbi:endolytic transglycosylase MltG [Nocardioides perillae]|uniref:Endolytic murein transglycosylase n=1 Tax=Nocardioides perillae TaxID=1119534 RepID=A0A7Y9RTK7_9ACTN|nr:endolytic transglycosylase MltG [Nocardioides perillae]NYG56080.1 UPF0755 protein [Nocardioides perillae]
MNEEQRTPAEPVDDGLDLVHDEAQPDVLLAADPDPDADPDPGYTPGGRRRRKKRVPGCLAALVALTVVVAGFYVAVTKGVDYLSSAFGEAEDYPGPGSGSVLFEVEPGDTVAQMGRELKELGVIASVQALTDAALGNEAANGIQVGTYELREEMRASDALEVLVDPANIVRSTVTVPEGLRLEQVLDVLAEGTEFRRGRFERVLEQPGSIGLPDYAGGDAEGYLFPATYDVAPGDTPRDILRAMVDRWRQAADEAGLEQAAADLGYTPHELMTVASLVEAEGRGDDMPRISRVIYNRLEGEETNGLLQIDATVNYAAGNDLGAVPTLEDLEVDSPYNTYQNPGLPPGPIEMPGAEAIEAAANPAEGDWFYYVTVDLATGETKFAETYDEFLRYKDELRDYCANESDRC